MPTPNHSFPRFVWPHSRLLYWLLVLLMMLGTSAAAAALPTTWRAELPLPLDTGRPEIFIAPFNYSVLEDPSGRLTLHDVQQPRYAERFVSGARAASNMEHPGSTYWLRLTVQAVGPQPQHWYLELFDSHINDISFFPKTTTEQGRIHTGADYPFATRRYGYKNYLLPLPIASNAPQTYYLRLQSGSRTSFLSKVRTEQGIAEHFQLEYGLLGAFYGMLLIMIVYNFWLFCFTGEQTYLRYVLYVLSCSLVFLSEDGLGFQYLWPSHPRLNWVADTISPPLLLLTFGYYARQFLDTPQRLPRYDQWLRAVVLLSVAALLLDGFWWKTGMSMVLYLLPYGMLFFAALRVWQQGFLPARFVLLAHSLVAISVLFLILRKLGIDTFTTPFTVYSMNAAFVVEVVVLSYALGEKIRSIQRATLKVQQRLVKQLRKKHDVQHKLVEQLRQNEELKDQLNSELENLVTQRTAELQRQGETIATQNRNLVQANSLLALQSAAIEKLNTDLQYDLQKAQTARVLSQEVDFGEFSQIYPNKETCLSYLADLKWTDGYHCRKCGHDNYCEGREALSRRCTRCRYVESATAYTLLQKCKFSVVKAFYAVFLLHTHNGSYSAQELSKVLDLRRATCSSFSQKVLEAMRRQSTDSAGEEGWTCLLLDDTGTEPDESIEDELAVTDELAQGMKRELRKLKNK